RDENGVRSGFSPSSNRTREFPSKFGQTVLSRGQDGENPDLTLTLLHDLDALDDVAFDDSIHDVDAVEDLRKDGVLVIEPRVVDEIDEDLRVAGVAPARRDADRAAHVRPRSDFVAHERGVADVLVRAGTPALNDEVRHDPVKRQTVV